MTTSEYRGSATGSVPTVTVTPTLELELGVEGAGTERTVVVRVHNRGAAAFVFDRNWRLGKAGRRPDPQPVYRFVRSASLRLLLGAAPPGPRPVAYRNIPNVTRVERGKTLERRFALVAIEREYNPYFLETDPDDDDPTIESREPAPTTLEPVRELHLIVHSLSCDATDAGGAVELRPGIDDDALDLRMPVRWFNQSSVFTASAAVDPFVAERRADAFARVRLPGEPRE